jgi:hypothetical protein
MVSDESVFFFNFRTHRIAGERELSACHLYKDDDDDDNNNALWNQGIQTDREVLANRPDIIIKNKKDKTAY